MAYFSHFAGGVTPLNIDEVKIPYTRFREDYKHARASDSPTFRSTFERAAEMTEQLANDAMENLMEGHSMRIHAGQSGMGISGSAVTLSTSAINVPEVLSGTLVSARA